LIDNNLNLLIPEGTILDFLFYTSPRRVVQDVYKLSALKYPSLVRPQWAVEMALNGEAAFAVWKIQK